MAGVGLFASALSDAISKWMDKEGEVAEKTPQMKQSALDLARSRALAPGEIEAQRLGLEKSRQDLTHARASEERAASLHPSQVRRGAAEAESAEQATRRNPIIEHSGIKYEQLPDGSFREITKMGRDPASRLAEAQINEKLQELARDANFRQRVAQLSQGKNMNDPEIATQVGIQAAFASGKIQDGLNLVQAYSQLQHYKAQESQAAAKAAQNERLANIKAAEQRARQAYLEKRAAAGWAGSGAGAANKPLTAKDRAGLMTRATAQAWKEANRMQGDTSITPAEREAIDDRALVLYKQFVEAAEGKVQEKEDPVTEALTDLRNALTEDQEE